MGTFAMTKKKANSWVYPDPPNPRQNEPNPIVAANLSCNGVSEFFNAENYLEKFFWGSVLLIAFVGLIYGWVILGYRFFYQSAASLSTTHHNRTMEIPELAICSSIPLNVTKILQEGIDEELLPLLHWHFAKNPYEQVTGGFLKVPEALPADSNKTRKNSTSQSLLFQTWDKFVLHNGIHCNEFLLACSINYDHFFNCCERAKVIIHEKLGRCFVMEGLSVGTEGSQGGLIILAKSQRSAMIPDGLDGENFLSLNDGIVLEYAHKYIPPYTYGAHEQILLGTDITAYISLSMTKHERFIDCSNTVRPGHSHAACRKSCFNLGLEYYCNCTLLGFQDLLDNVTFCNPSQSSACFGEFGYPNSPRLNEFMEACIPKQCSLQCKETKVLHTLSMAPLDAKLVSLARNENPINNASYIKIHLYYPQLVYTFQQEFSVVTWDSVLSSVGGTMGLYLGASLITFVQIIVLVVKYCAKKVLCG